MQHKKGNASTNSTTLREKVVVGSSVVEDTYEETPAEGGIGTTKKLVSRSKLLELTHG